MQPPVRLIRAEASRLTELLPLFRAYQAHYPTLTSASEQQTHAFLARFLEQPEGGFVVLAEVEGAVVGFATGYVTVTGVMAERLLHLGDLYVAPEHRRRGIATALVRDVARRAGMDGIRFVRWLSLAANSELNRWYESLGATSGDFKLFLLPTSESASPPAPERAADHARPAAD